MNKYIILLIVSITLFSCEKVLMEKDPASNPTEVFNYLWKQMDEKYSYFDYKKVNWDSIKTVYSSQINDNLTDDELFAILFKMMCEVRDNHTNLISPFNISRYTDKYPIPRYNFDWRTIKNKYIGNDYLITGALYNNWILNTNKKIGYIYYSSFADAVDDYSLDYVMNRFSNADGLIIDVRNNGGGSPTNIFKILSRIVPDRRLVYKSRMKIGKAHNSFGESLYVYAEPDGNYQFTKKIIVLTNKNSYSATSFFATATKAYDNIIIIGDSTGGGLGAPTGGELPNGWTYRFSASQTSAKSNSSWNHTDIYEDGVPPDIYVTISDSDFDNEIDSILERAIDEI